MKKRLLDSHFPLGAIMATLAMVLSIILLNFLLNFPEAEAFTSITAQEAYTMLSRGEADLLDVRTLEEYTFVGSPALEPGGEPIAYLIPWKLFGGLDDRGQTIYKNNPDFDSLVEQTFGSSKERALIVMCAVGIRSGAAAKRLEELGFSRVYEIDNKFKHITATSGGFGGFQGSNYQNAYNGYKGYPGRLPAAGAESAAQIKVAIATDQIEHEHDSVSWMDSGLPITYKTDPKKIPKLKKTEPTAPPSSSSGGASGPSTSAYPAASLPYSAGGYQPIPYNLQQALSSPTSPNWYQSSLVGAVSLWGISSPLASPSWTTTGVSWQNQSLFPSLYQGMSLYQGASYFAPQWQTGYPQLDSSLTIDMSFYEKNPPST